MTRPQVHDDAFYGLAGRIVKTIDPHTEADPVAVLAVLLTAVGSVLGRSAYWRHGGTRHYCNLFTLLVGPTSAGRKGTATSEALRVMRLAAPEWADVCVVSGLSSGEGLAHHLRDPDGDEAEERDKRLLAVESEFARPLRAMEREGNTLSAIARSLWETDHVQVLTRGAPLKATGCHLAIVGNTSVDELRRRLDDEEIANGLANRILYFYTERSKQLPHGGSLTDLQLEPLVEELQEAIEFGQALEEVKLDAGATSLWEQLYEALTNERPGVFGAVIARRAPNARRLAVVYAVLDRSPIVTADHLWAALQLTEYATLSARHIFGDRLGDQLADRVRGELIEAGDAGMSRQQIRALVGNRVPAQRITEALGKLQHLGLADCRKLPTGGKPAEWWMSR